MSFGVQKFSQALQIDYYNDCIFYIVEKDFTAETGDPNGTRTGGNSIYKLINVGDRFFDDEIHRDLNHTKAGTVAMVNHGENLNASEFYITLSDELNMLDGKHTVFGEVVEGFDTLTVINTVEVDEDCKAVRDGIKIIYTMKTHSKTYSTSVKKMEKEIAYLVENIEEQCSIKECDMTLAHRNQWNLILDKEII
ncbi:unnamed protein product [Arabis nemorensis]|uniref:Peptidyl-prolyl cis-trans isomerase n=1 Tax=Arabis nemorensis TaxID=586526 RepID=A0A565BFA4_9BRAS|nr:unnamed protein product [Arabis nemorensis]